MTLRALVLVVAVLLLPLVVLAGAFSYRHAYSTVTVAPPVVWFEDPLRPGVYVELHRHKTYANVTVSFWKPALRLANRSGLALDLTSPEVVQNNFEKWVERGCEHSITTDGVYISVVGNPQRDGYRGCLLIYREPVVAANLAVSFAMRTDDTGTNYGIRGVLLMNGTGYYYMVGLKNNQTGWFFGIYKYVGRTVREPGGPVVPPLLEVKLEGTVISRWLVVAAQLTYLADGRAPIRAWLYDAVSGKRLAQLEVIDAAPINGLNRFGIGVYQIVNKPSAVFRIIGFTSILHVLVARGLAYCCDVYVYDSAGAVVGSAHANEAGIAEILLSSGALVNATVRVMCGAVEYEVPAWMLLGGDVYEFYLWFEGPILRVHASSLSTGWVKVESAECTAPIYYVQVGLVNGTYASDINARVIWAHGETVVLIPETSTVLLTPTDTGWAGNVTLRAELYVFSQCTLRLALYYSFVRETREVYGCLEARVTLRPD